MDIMFTVIIQSKGNVEYLKEAIDSLLNQSIGFYEMIQLIVINRQSNYETIKLTKEYIEEYPDNIISFVVSDDMTSGVAKNSAVRKADGMFINFMQEQDRWSISAFKKALYYFERVNKKSNMLVCRIRHFGANRDYSANDYLYKSTRKISLSEKKDLSQFTLGNVFLRRNIFNSYSFDDELDYGEDFLLLNQIIISEREYYTIHKIIYNQRIKKINKFATKFDVKKESYYLKTPKKAYFELFDMCYSKKTLEEAKYLVIDEDKNRYVQRLIMHELALRIKDHTVDIALNPEQKKKYIMSLKEIIRYIDDDIIYSSSDIFVEHKLYIMKLKYDDFYSRVTYEGHGKIYFNNTCVYDLNKRDIVRVETIDIEGNVVKIDGRIGIPFPSESYELYFEDQNGKRYKDFDYKYNERIYALGDVCFERRSFHLRIPVNESMVITPYIRYAGKRFSLKINLRKWSKIEGKFQHSYYMKNGIVIQKNIKNFTINRTNDRSAYERQFKEELLERGEKKHVRIRKIVFLYKKIFKRPVWLIADNLEDGNDNSEILAKWISENNNKIKLVFVLNSDSPAKKRIKKICKVVNYDSFWHRLYFLISEYFICSRTDPHIYNFLGKDSKYYKDLYPSFIYLQHGVLEKDFTRAVNKYVNNFRLFITSALPEYESMLKLPYGWDESEIKLTGLARHDDIYRMRESKNDIEYTKEIIVAPTWRKNLAKKENKKWVYNPNFKESAFFEFYNRLINDERLIEVMKTYGYVGKLRIHTVIKANVKDFELNDVFSVDDRSLLFEEQFRSRDKILLTDYSSIAADYAYGKIPVIYTQFDIDEFYNTQSYDEGDFDYEKDGFGQVCYDYESTIDALIRQIRIGCNMSDEILKRRNDYFPFYDDHNCERIYNEIINIEHNYKY